MNAIIEHNDSEKGVTVDIPQNTSSTGAESSISLKTYQDIYHQITGRTEQIRQRYNNNLLVDFAEIEQLHFKIWQLRDVHNIIASNELISVFHKKERKEQFTSFSRFKLYNTNTAKPTVSVVLKYNFSINLPGIKNLQEYVVTIRINSRVATLDDMESEIPSFMRGRILKLSGMTTAEISVEYADYIIARSFIEAFSDWIEGCNSTPKNKLLSVVQDRSHFIPNFLRLGISILFIYFFLNSLPNFLLDSSQENLGRFIVIFLGSFYMITSISMILGQYIEFSIDNIQQKSYLKLNKGDENLIKKFNSRNNKTIRKFLLGCSLSIGLSVIASFISDII